jgi:hypothetical protein
MIERMIRDLDTSTTGSKNVRIFKLQNADASAMARDHHRPLQPRAGQ